MLEAAAKVLGGLYYTNAMRGDGQLIAKMATPAEQRKALDALLATVQMPAGIPVATVAIGNAQNAGLLAAEILALSDDGLAERLEAWRAAQTQGVLDDPSNAEG